MRGKIRHAQDTRVSCILRRNALTSRLLLAAALTAGALLAAAGCSLFFPPAGDTSVPGATGSTEIWSIADLSQVAGHIVQATVSSVQSLTADSGGVPEIVTDVMLAVSGYLKGKGPASLVVRTLGGQVGDVLVECSNEPCFVAGEEVIVFIGPHGPADPALAGHLGVVGAIKGKLTVAGGTVLEMGIAATEVVARVTRALSGETMDVDPQFVPLAKSQPASVRVVPRSYSYSGQRWTSLPVSYYLNVGTGFADPTKAAAATWNNVGSKFQLYYAGTTKLGAVSGDGKNVVCSANYGATVWQAESLSRVRVTNGVSTLVECDIRINTYYPFCWCSSRKAFDTQSEMTHEFGHWVRFLDLRKPADSEMTMFYICNMGETKRITLEADEKAGLLKVYGKK